MVLVCASVLVTSRQYIGDPIDCMADGVPGGIMDTYCWIHGTFSIPERWEGKEGVYHKYYQWVCYVLFLQAGLFYFPRQLWKTMEGGRLRMLVQDMCEPRFVVDKSSR